MAMGRFPHGLKVSVEEMPRVDAFYVRIGDASEDPAKLKELVGALRSRHCTDEANKRLQYWEIFDADKGRFLLYQASNQTCLTNATSNLATLFQRTGLDARLAGELRYLDLQGLAVLGILSEPAREEESEDE